MRMKPPAIWGEVGARVQRLRLSQGYSIEQLAAAAGLRPQHVQRIEAGQAGTTPVQLGSIAAALSVTARDLWPTEPVEALARALYQQGLSDAEVERVMTYIQVVEMLDVISL